MKGLRNLFVCLSIIFIFGFTTSIVVDKTILIIAFVILTGITGIIAIKLHYSILKDNEEFDKIFNK